MRLRKTILAVSLTLGVAAGGIVLAAQGDNQGNPSVLAAIQSLRADLTAAFTSLSQTLQAIQNTLSSLIPPAQSNVKVTPPMVFPEGTSNNVMTCTVANLANATRNIEFTIITGPGTGGPGAANVVPEGIASSSTLNFTSSSAYCRFTVTNGVASDISASATQIVNGQIVAVVGAN